MRTHRAGSHTPHELRRASDLAHRVEGVLLLVVAVLAIAGNVFGIAWASIAWPVLVLMAGLLLLLAIYPTHPVGDWPLIWRDPQQRQHTTIALALIAAGTAEFFRSSPAGLGRAQDAELSRAEALEAPKGSGSKTIPLVPVSPPRVKGGHDRLMLAPSPWQGEGSEGR